LLEKIAKSKKLTCPEYQIIHNPHQYCINNLCCSIVNDENSCEKQKQYTIQCRKYASDAVDIEIELNKKIECAHQKKIRVQILKILPQSTEGKDSPCRCLESICEEIKCLHQKYKEYQCMIECWEALIPEHIWENVILYNKAKDFMLKIFKPLENCADQSMDDVINNSIIVAKNLRCNLVTSEDRFVSYLEEMDASINQDDLINDALFLIEKHIEYGQKNREERIYNSLKGHSHTYLGEKLYIILPDLKSLSPDDALHKMLYCGVLPTDICMYQDIESATDEEECKATTGQQEQQQPIGGRGEI
jgi:hypothetical protein